MTSKLKDKFNREGFLVVRNVLNFNFDLKPILNDVEFIMNRLVYKFVPKKKNVTPYLNIISGKNIPSYQN